MEVILNINNLKYKNLFNDLNLNIERCKLITLAGKNNSGKTTLARILDRRITDNFNIILDGKEYDTYTIEVYDSKVQVVFPMEISFLERTIQEELYLGNASKDKIEYVLKRTRLDKLRSKEIQKLTSKDIILLQIIKAIINSNEIVVLDNIDYYFTKEELREIYDLLRRCINKWDLTFLIMTTSLTEALYTDELYILKEGKIILKGDPLKVLEKDNIINKAGLNIPFMIDLSVKLRDYELIDKIELYQQRLIDTLWK